MTRSSLISTLAILGAVSAGCGSSSGSGDQCSTPSSGMEAKYVLNALTVPPNPGDFALDLNGDGKPDNQLGKITAGLKVAGLDTQAGIDKAIVAGNVILLIDQTGADLTNNDCATAKFSVGKPQTMPAPKFDGSDALAIDPAVAGGALFGKIANGAFSSNNPATATTNYQISILLPLVAGAAPLNLTLSAAHLQFTKAGDGLMKGQINGAIKNSDVQTNIIPQVATLLTQQIAANPTSDATKQIKMLFDVGDGGSPPMPCTNPDGSMSAPNDGVIGICEVSGNPTIKNLLSPDVQLFDSAGNYKPNPDKNAVKDSLSVGLAFTAVKASF